MSVRDRIVARGRRSRWLERLAAPSEAQVVLHMGDAPGRVLGKALGAMLSSRGSPRVPESVTSPPDHR